MYLKVVYEKNLIEVFLDLTKCGPTCVTLGKLISLSVSPSPHP